MRWLRFLYGLRCRFRGHETLQGVFPHDHLNEDHYWEYCWHCGKRWNRVIERDTREMREWVDQDLPHEDTYILDGLWTTS